MYRFYSILFIVALFLTGCAAPWSSSSRPQTELLPQEKASSTAITPDVTVLAATTPTPIASPTRAPFPTVPPTPTEVPVAGSFPAGCHLDQGSESTPATSSEVCVITYSPQLPDACSLEQVTRLVTRFLEAFNGGDADTANSLFLDEPSFGSNASHRLFQWYSAGGWDGVESITIYDPAELTNYFTTRAEQHDRLELRGLTVRKSGPSTVGISYQITRRADDLSERTVTGKGEINCTLQKIYVWSMGAG